MGYESTERWPGADVTGPHLRPHPRHSKDQSPPQGTYRGYAPSTAWLVLEIEQEDVSEQLMGQGPDRGDVCQREGDLFLELLFGLVEGTDSEAVFVDYLRELVFCRGDGFGQGLYLLFIRFYLGLGFRTRPSCGRFGTLHFDAAGHRPGPRRGRVMWVGRKKGRVGGGGEVELEARPHTVLRDNDRATHPVFTLSSDPSFHRQVKKRIIIYMQDTVWKRDAV